MFYASNSTRDLVLLIQTLEGQFLGVYEEREEKRKEKRKKKRKEGKRKKRRESRRKV
jgi:hypothetical protein